MGRAEALERVVGGGTGRVAVRVFDGSRAGPADAPVARRDPLAAGAVLPGHRAGRPRAGPGLRHRRPRGRRRPLHGAGAPGAAGPGAAAGASGCDCCASSAGSRLLRPPPRPAQEVRLRGRRHSKARDQRGHRAPLRRVQPLLRAGCSARRWPTPARSTRRADATLEEAQFAKHDLVARKLGAAARACGCSTSAAAGAAWSCTPPGDYGVRALGVTLSRRQAEWAQKAIAEAGLSDLAEVRHLDYRDVRETELRRDQLDRPDRAHRPGAAAGATSGSCYDRLRPRRPAAQPLHHPAATTASRRARALVHQPLRLPRRRADRRRPPRLGHARHRLRGAPRGEPARALRADHRRVVGATSTRTGTRRSPRSAWPRARVWRLYLAGVRLGFERNQIQLHQVLGVKLAPGRPVRACRCVPTGNPHPHAGDVRPPLTWSWRRRPSATSSPGQPSAHGVRGAQRPVGGISTGGAMPARSPLV